MSHPWQNLWLLVRRHKRVAAVAAIILAIFGLAGAAHLWAAHHHRRALHHVERENFPEARAHVHQCLRVWWWRTADTYFLAARLERLAGDLVAAEELLRQSNQLRGETDEPAQIEAMLIQVETGHLARVEPVLWNLVSNGHTESPEILRVLSRIYFRDVRYKLAGEALEMWVTMSPHSGEAWERLGDVYNRLHNDANAEKAFRKAVEAAPERDTARFALVKLLVSLNADPKEIEGHLQKLLAKDPDRPEYLVALARCKMLAGDFSAARALLDRLVELHPKHSDALMCRAELEYQAGQFNATEVWARKILANDRTTVDPYHVLQAHQLLSESLRKQKDPKKLKEAQEHEDKYQKGKLDAKRVHEILGESFEKYKDNPDVLTELGAIYLRNGQEESGLLWINQALLRAPFHQGAHRLLAGYFRKKNQPKLAAEHELLAQQGSSQ